MSAHPIRLRRRLVALALGLWLLSPLLAAAPAASAAGATHRAAQETSIAQAVFQHINHERAVHHLHRLTTSVQLVHSAHRHNVKMAKADLLSHQLPGEAFFADRMQKAGYHWLWAGENIAWNSLMTRGGVLTLQQLMYHEKPPENGHRLNILNPHYRNVGVDVYLDNAHHKVWLTTDFGCRR